MKAAPIALFVYNRPEHTRQVVEALRKNEGAADSDLFVFSDAAKDDTAENAVQEVRRYLGDVQGFRSVNVVSRENNLGLANSIIDGVTRISGEHGRVIVLEDDLVTSPFFLHFMNEALDVYKDEDKVASVHGYWYPVDRPVPETIFLRGASCWGWATWSRAWRLFERDGSALMAELSRKDLASRFDLDGAFPYMWLLREQVTGKNNSWAIRWHAATFLADKLQLSPGRSLVRNIGFDGSGVHSTRSRMYDTALASTPVGVVHREPSECIEARAALIRFYRGHTIKPTILTRAYRGLRRIVGL